MADTSDSMYATVTDDCGIIGMVDLDQYVSFVGNHASHRDFTDHILGEMSKGVGLVWGTGREGEWRICVRFGLTSQEGFREFRNTLRISSGILLFSDFDVMAIDSEDGDAGAIAEGTVDSGLSPGQYTCRVIQMYDPDDLEDDINSRDADFVVELERPALDTTTSRTVNAIMWL